MNNYNLEKLTDYLRASEKQSEALTFDEIEKLIGEPLPLEAKKNPSWWKTEQKNKRAHFWTDAGFCTFENENIIARGNVCFLKKEVIRDSEKKSPVNKVESVIKWVTLIAGGVALIFTIVFSLMPNAPILERFLLFSLLVVFYIFFSIPIVKTKQFKKLRCSVLGVTGFFIILIIGHFIINEWNIIRDSNKSLSMSLMPFEYKPLPVKMSNDDSVEFFCSDMAPVFDYSLFNNTENAVTVTSIKLIINEYEEFTAEDICEHVWIKNDPTDMILKREDELLGENDQSSISRFELDFVYIGGKVYHDKKEQEIYIIEDGTVKKDARLTVDKYAYLRFIPEVKESGHYKIQFLVNYTDLKGQNEYKSDAIDIYYLDDTIEEVLREHASNTELFKSLGDAFSYRGNYEKAIDYYKKALEINEKEYGYEHIKTAITYSDIGNAYMAQRDYAKALEYYEKAAEISEKVLGPDNYFSAVIYNYIGEIYLRQRDYAKSLEYYEKAVEICEKAPEPEYEFTTATYNNIARVYRRQRDYSKALEYYEKAIESYEKVLGTEDQCTAIIYSNMGGVYRDLHDYVKALENYEKALEVYEKVLGPESNDSAIIYNNIGKVYQDQGDYAKAQEYYEKALEVYEKLLWPENQYAVATYESLGETYRAKEDYAKARECFEKAIEIYERMLGPENYKTALMYINIGETYMTQEDYAKAREYFEKVVEIYEKVFGPEDGKTAEIYNNIGLMYRYQKDYAKALEYYEKAIEIFEKEPEADNLWIIGTYLNIALVYHDQSETQKEMEYFEKTAGAAEKMLGSESPDFAVICHTLGVACYNIQQYAKANIYLQKAYDIRVNELGSDDPDTVDTLNYLKLVQKEMEQ